MSDIFTVTLPDIGEGVVEGEVIEWLKQPNDMLQQDEPVVVIMTDKATVELPSPYPGKLVKQYYQAGQIAIKDQPLYDIETAGEGPTNVDSEEKDIKKKDIKDKGTKDTKDMDGDRAKDTKDKDKGPKGLKPALASKVMAAPHTRKLARQLNVNLNQIQGTGPNGLVTDENVIRAHAGSEENEVRQAQQSTDKAFCTPPLRLPGFTETPIIGIRHLMAKKMSESKDLIPHFSYFEQVDATRLVQLRHSFKEEGDKQGIGVTYMPFLIKALSLTLQRYPEVNSSIDSTKNVLVLNSQHNIGIAITTRDGLIVPVLKNVQNMSLQEVVIAYEDLKQRALNRELRPSEMKESTITVSNFGVLGGGGLWATPIINYPEVAILAVAKIHKQPLVRNDTVVIRDVLNLSWSFDHRVIDGDMAVSFSHYFSTLLQNPAPLL